MAPSASRELKFIFEEMQSGNDLKLSGFDDNIFLDSDTDPRSTTFSHGGYIALLT